MNDRLLRQAPPTCVSVIIKALNEERRIAAAITSALTAVSGVGGEVVLADSCSTDRTVEIASAYPIRIVQLADPAQRCCGVGPQLGYEHARGHFVYILDGDMRMHEGFLEAALDFLATHPQVGGVAGQVIEKNLSSLEYRARVARATEAMRPGAADRLDMGGLYRREAIEQAGYLSDRNLHSYEEFDLAVRLRTLGWQLWRLDVPAVDHWGHDVPAAQLLARRWRSNYILGIGEVVRAAWGRPWFVRVLTDLRELRIYALTCLWLATLCALPLGGVVLGTSASLTEAWVAVAALPWLAMAARKRSISMGTYSVASWCMHVGGLVRGLWRRRSDPRAPIDFKLIRDH